MRLLIALAIVERGFAIWSWKLAAGSWELEAGSWKLENEKGGRAAALLLYESAAKPPRPAQRTEVLPAYGTVTVATVGASVRSAADTGLAKRPAIVAANSTKITAPMAAPTVRPVRLFTKTPRRND